MNGTMIGYFLLALTAVLVFLKLTKRIRWRWIWVLAPLWASLLLGVLAAFLTPILLKSQG